MAELEDTSCVVIVVKATEGHEDNRVAAGHTERVGEGLYKNVPGEFDMGLFTSAVQYFS